MGETATTQFRLRFSDTEDTVDLFLLGDFLLLFRATYAICLRSVIPPDLLKSNDAASGLLEAFRHYIDSLTVSQIDSVFAHNPESEKLGALTIRRDSPMELVVYGIMVALCAAVILSGGRFKMAEVEADLPPLGEGIKKLREALRPYPRFSLRYGLQGTIVKLSRDEYKELMRHDPSSAARGGFQRFIIGLQGRINGTTREIVLTSGDVDRIVRHARHRSRGGFQSSLNKIFGRHFEIQTAARELTNKT